MPSKIFISYRRDDSADAAGRLYDNLLAHFDKEQIFMDIDYIEPGEDFVQVITDAVSSCQIFIAVIGRSWLSSSKDGSTRRLDNPNDFVRLEIATALSLNLRVIPVLVQGATMPTPYDLPDDLVKLSYRNAFEISHTRWKRDVESLISSLKKILDKQQEALRAEEQRQREARIAADEQRKRDEEEAARLAEEERRKQETEKTVLHTKEERQKELSDAALRYTGKSPQRIAAKQKLQRGKQKFPRGKQQIAATPAQSLSPSSSPPPLIPTPVTVHESMDAPKPIYKNPRAMIVIVAVVVAFVVLFIFIWTRRTDTNGNQFANENQSSIESQTSPVPPSPTPLDEIAQFQPPVGINSNISNANNSNVMESNANNSNVIEPNANNSNVIESNTNSSSSTEGLTHLTPIRASETPEGSRIMITSDGALSDYSAYRSGNRFYVLIPAAEAPRILGGLRGRGFDDVRIQQRGDDVLLSFRLLSGAAARVSTKFNRLEILITVPALVAANAAANSNNANVRKSSPSTGRNSGKQSKPNKP
jgi:hypothetical protein